MLISRNKFKTSMSYMNPNSLPFVRKLVEQFCLWSSQYLLCRKKIQEPQQHRSLGLRWPFYQLRFDRQNKDRTPSGIQLTQKSPRTLSVTWCPWLDPDPKSEMFRRAESPKRVSRRKSTFVALELIPPGGEKKIKPRLQKRLFSKFPIPVRAIPTKPRNLRYHNFISKDSMYVSSSTTEFHCPKKTSL